MCRMAGEVADGIHVHPFHSLSYIHNRLLPAVAEGAQRSGRSPGDVDLIIPVFAIPGDTPEERSELVEKARARIAFYGSTKNYSFQFDDLGFEGTSARLNDLLKRGDVPGMAATITDEMMEHYAVIETWDGMADALIKRYDGLASRLVMYMGEDSIEAGPGNLERWAEIARVVTRPKTGVSG
jgi:alkanesulfonate monooxygenase SsuD/methylene tetrahydromethanopterin reductase-like flavin-dependent oxidoreductase (luciferase family)